MEKEHSELFLVDIYQLFVFKKLHPATFIIRPTTTEADTLYKFTEDKCNRFCNDYISEKLHNPYIVQIHTVYPPSLKKHTVKVSLEHLLTANGNRENSPN